MKNNQLAYSVPHQVHGLDLNCGELIVLIVLFKICSQKNTAGFYAKDDEIALFGKISSRTVTNAKKSLRLKRHIKWWVDNGTTKYSILIEEEK